MSWAQYFFHSFLNILKHYSLSTHLQCTQFTVILGTGYIYILQHFFFSNTLLLSPFTYLLLFFLVHNMAYNIYIDWSYQDLVHSMLLFLSFPLPSFFTLIFVPLCHFCTGHNLSSCPFLSTFYHFLFYFASLKWEKSYCFKACVTDLFHSVYIFQVTHFPTNISNVSFFMPEQYSYICYYNIHIYAAMTIGMHETAVWSFKLFGEDT